MHQRSDVDEFDDDGQIDMSGIDCACGAPREQSQQRPKTFPTAADRVNDVPFDCGIECCSLLPDARLDLLRDAVELISPLRQDKAPANRPRSQLRHGSCWIACGRRVPRSENNGAAILEQACSSFSAKFATETLVLPFMQPGITSVFFLN